MILELNLKRRRFNHELIVSSPTIGLRAKQNRDPHKCPRFPPIWHQGEMKTKTSLRREEKRIRDDQKPSIGDAYCFLRRSFPGNGVVTRVNKFGEFY
jgi:hypothetical protein